MLTYEEALAFVNGQQRFGRRPELGRMKRLCAALGDPQDALHFVHVAGTNGKGSTTRMVASALEAAGYRTGLFISPYVVEFTERIQVDGAYIPKGRFAALAFQVKQVALEMEEEGEPPNTFECVTAVAFLYFKEQGCDVVCLEVGLGGRFDATNVIKTPLVTVITAISRDHMAYLGDTIQEIAGEKCGVIKEGATVVCNPCEPVEALSVILERCAQVGATLIQPGLASVERLGGSGLYPHFRYKEMEFALSLAGEYQVENALTAIEALLALRAKGFSISREQLIQGVSGATFPGRMEVLGKDPLLLLDGAHNEGGIIALAKSVKRLSKRPRVGIVGVLADKEYGPMLADIAPYFDLLYCTSPDNPRALPAEELAEMAGAYCPAYVADSPEGALRLARAEAGSDGAVVGFGSLYLISELRNLLKLTDFYN